MQEMRSYDGGDSSQFIPQMQSLRERRSLFWWPGSLTAQETYEVQVYVYKLLVSTGYATFKHYNQHKHNYTFKHYNQ